MRYAVTVHRAWPWLLSMCLLACAGEALPDVEPDATPTADASTASIVDGVLSDVGSSRQAAQDVGPSVALDTVDTLGDPLDSGPPSEVAEAGATADSVVNDTWRSDAAPDALESVDAVETGAEGLAPDAVQAVPLGAAPGRAPMRRLTRREVDLTLRDLTGVTGVAAKTLPPEPETQGFDNHVDAQSVGPTFVEAQLLMAEVVAAEVELELLLPCDPEVDGQVPCGHAFITEFGRRAMRRPLTDPQHARFAALFEQSLTEWGFEDATRLVLTALLMSPHFLYRVELGVPETEVGGVVRLSPHEMASRLSYLLYGSMPDAELAAAADAGELMNGQSVAEQATRMLDAFGAREMMDRFHRQWLHLDRLLYMAPVSVKFASFRTESRVFVQRTLFEGEGTFSALMTSAETVADGAVSLVYGQPEFGAPVDSWIPGAEGFQAVSLDPARRAGVLTHPSVLSVNSVGPSAAKTLIRRGVFVLDRVLCSPLPPPPDETPQLPLDEDTELSPPDLLAQHTSDPACAGCHGVIDPVGKAFEHYSAIGSWRDVYHDGTAVEAQTEFVGTPVDGAYSDAVELAHTLAQSEAAQRCYTRHWYRFAHGRAVEEGDAAAFDVVLEAFLSAEGDVRTLVEALTTTDAFLYRPSTPAELGGEP
jgi:hypothetical protein